MASRRWFFGFATALLTLTQSGRGQGALSWTAFRAGDGLAQSACVAVSISSQGKVLVRHGDLNLASELDGYNVTTFAAPGNFGGPIASSPSGQLWTLAPGGLQERRGDAWLFQPVPEIGAAFRDRNLAGADSVSFLPIRQGRVLVLLPDRLIELNVEQPGRIETTEWRAVWQTGLGEFRGMAPAPDAGLWISGVRGVARIPGPVRSGRPDVEWQEHLIPEAFGIRNLSRPHADADDSLTVVAESTAGAGQFIAHFDGAQWRAQSVGVRDVLVAWRGPDQRFWAMSDTALFVSEPGGMDLSENDEISARRFFDVAIEAAGTFCVATSDGLFRYAPPSWRSPASTDPIDSAILSMTEAGGGLWFVSASRLFAVMGGRLQEHPLPTQIERAVQDESALYPLKDGDLLLVAGTDWLRFSPRQGWRVVTSIHGTARRVIGTLRDGTPCVWSADGAGPVGRLETYDGASFETFMSLPADVGQIGRLLTVFQSRDGVLWLGGELGTARWQDRNWRTFTSTDRTTPERGHRFIELTDDRIWCAAQDRIWEYDGRNWTMVRPGFDRIHNLLRSRDGSIWVAANSGLSRWWEGAWIENGVEEGLPSAVIRDVYETADGRLWAATGRGLSRYHPAADTDPPKTTVQKLTGEEPIREGGTLNLLFSGRDKWKFTRAGRLLYSYRLDQHDWSPFQELNAVSFPDLSAGKHYFQVRAMDRNGNIESAPAQLEFAVALPWYRETRLVLATVLGVGAAVFFGALAWNRHRRLLRSYAEVEREVAERTRQLERAGRELLHSQKMNALGTLAAGVAHDFNNILSIVKGSAQIIEDNLENPQKIRTRVDRIKTVVEQGSGIVKAMLGFSRESDAQPSVVDPNAVVQDTIRLLGDRFLREIDVRFEPAPDLPELGASRDFIQQILLNFIFNAAEAAARDTRVVLVTRQDSALPPGVVLMPAEAGCYVTFSVRDYGCGISRENLPRVFEPFFTTKALSARRGTGLGLSMVYELVKKMEGGLAVESAVGEGSTFTLIVPVRD